MERVVEIAYFVFFLIIAVGSVSLFVYFSGESDSLEESCVDVHGGSGLVFDACFDSSTKSIFLDVSRGNFAPYIINGMTVSFGGKNLDLFDIPSQNSNVTFKLPSESNPRTLDILLSVEKDFRGEICSQPHTVFVGSCVRLSKEEKEKNPDTTPDFGNGEGTLNNFSNLDNILFKENYWDSICSSDWECSAWGECIGGIQKRNCIDLNNCQIPTQSPGTARYCGEVCREQWQCTWSSCVDGVTTPSCTDANKCGTTYLLPSPVSCSLENENNPSCNPDIRCEAWSPCVSEYNFFSEGVVDVEEFIGIQSRICGDANSCIGSFRETKECYNGVDVYTERFQKCGEEFINIYDELTGELAARISPGGTIDSSFNIYLDEDEGDGIYCDYCFDGVLNGDEEDIDCGGSCVDCSEKYTSRGKTKFLREGVWQRFLDLFR